MVVEICYDFAKHSNADQSKNNKFTLNDLNYGKLTKPWLIMFDSVWYVLHDQKLL